MSSWFVRSISFERWWRPPFLSLFRGGPQVNGKTNALGNETTNGETQCDVGGGDRGATCATVGVQHVAIHVERKGPKASRFTAARSERVR